MQRFVLALVPLVALGAGVGPNWNQMQQFQTQMMFPRGSAPQQTHALPHLITMGNCLACSRAAAPGQSITFDPECLHNDGGPGCISIATPGEPAVFNGCRYCEFPPFDHISCDTQVCMDDTAPLIEGETCETCMAKAAPGRESLTFDPKCLQPHHLDVHGGLGCVSVAEPNAPPMFSGCRYCGFDQYSPVSCNTNVCSSNDLFPRAAEGETCQTCAIRAGAGERLTFDETCLYEGGLGCVSVATPGEFPVHNGCRFCEFGAYASVPCDTSLCGPLQVQNQVPAFWNKNIGNVLKQQAQQQQLGLAPRSIQTKVQQQQQLDLLPRSVQAKKIAQKLQQRQFETRTTFPIKKAQQQTVQQFQPRATFPVEKTQVPTYPVQGVQQDLTPRQVVKQQHQVQTQLENREVAPVTQQRVQQQRDLSTLKGGN